MPSRGRFTRERWREEWLASGFDVWEERVLARQHQHGRFSRRSRVLGPVIVSLVIQLPSVFFRARIGGPPTPLDSIGSWGFWLTLALALIGPAALLFARRFPGPVVAITAAAASVDLLLFIDAFHPPYVSLAFAIVSAIVRGARAWAWISVAAAWLLTLATAIGLGIALSPPRIAAITLGVLIVMGVGEAIRTRRERFADFSRRIAERKQSEVQAERVRIARELHDVLAHSLSQINVQAGVGLHLMERQPDKAAEALANIKETSKTALDEVRSVLGLLRAEGGADPSAPLVPEPNLSRLLGLAASIEAQGVKVHVENTVSTLPTAAVQLALYRIIQESLTNVLRHAKANSATITVAETPAEWLVTIADDGTGPGHPSHDSGGRGLLGMRERAELLGGSLETGAGVGGGFQVTARIPKPLARS